METNTLRLAEGGQITSTTQSGGDAGNIDIRATNVEVSSALVDFFGTSSGISASVGSRSTASGGSITLETDRLRVFDGGHIAAATGGGGVAGNLNIRCLRSSASSALRRHRSADDILVEGISGDSSSSISAESTSAFAAGSIDITADRLRVRDRGEITVSSEGTGDAGNLNITADLIDLDADGRLSSEVRSGDRGNITLNTDSIQMHRGSSIRGNATAEATGGNITIDTETLALINNSSISANAELGAGGNVQITVEGIFVSPDSSITATSELGLDGIVKIINPNVDTTSGLVKLPENVVNPSNQLSVGCAVAVGSSFTVTRRGGLPPNPSDVLRSDRPWADLRDLSA